MPRRPKGPRLHWREDREVYEIRDTGITAISTRTNDRREAEAALAAYIERKYRPSGPAGPEKLSISMCLSLYGEEHALHVASPERIGYAIDALEAFWKDQPVSVINGNTCRRYAKARVTRFGKPAANGTIRRELNVLQAALNYCHREGYLTTTPKVVLPKSPPPRTRWLNRHEAAWLLRAARSLNKDGRHLADFILCGLYTGTRKQAILSLHIDTPSVSGGWVDLENGLLYRAAKGEVETSKRKGSARLPRAYLAHLKRQKANGRRYVVEDGKGRRVGDIRKGWSRAIALARKMAAKKGVEIDLSDVTPHTLKHTSITWMMQRGVPIWEVAGYFSTSYEIIEKVYGHHSPDHQKAAIASFDRRA